MEPGAGSFRYVPVAIAEGIVGDAFEALGVPEVDARVCADALVAADRRGIASHGIGRLRYYCDSIRAGIQSPQTSPEVIRETPTTALVDGHHGMGPVIAVRATEMAIQKARHEGLGAVAVRNGTHFGIAGYYSLLAAAEGMIGLTVTNAHPATAPTFSTEPLLGTNPIAFAAPSDLPYPFCFDGATSVVSQGKIEVLARIGKPAPLGWVIDPAGDPLTDPDQILAGFANETAAMLPLGGAGEALAGYKGYGLATMVEILSAALSGGPFLKDLGGVAPDGSPRPYSRGQFFLAIDVEHFLPLAEFRRITGQILRALQGARQAPGVDRVYVAGEKEHESEVRVQEQGIPVPQRLLVTLRTLLDELGVSGYEVYLYE